MGSSFGELDLAIVVLNWKDEERTVRCVESLLADERIALVLVVDNETRHLLRNIWDGNPRVDLIEIVENRGFAGGTNVGLASALDRGLSWVGTINSDARVVSGSLADLCESALVDESIGAVGPMIVGPDGGVQSLGSRVTGWSASTWDMHKPTSGRIDYLTWACLVLSASALRRIGLLNESFFMYWEDTEFGLRLRDSGYNLMVNDRVLVEHELSASHQSGGWRIDYYSALGLAMMARLRGNVWWMGTLLRVAGRVAVRRPWSPEGRASLRGYWFGLRMDTGSPAWKHLWNATLLRGFE